MPSLRTLVTVRLSEGGEKSIKIRDKKGGREAYFCYLKEK